jgi:hypothetical protein
MRVQAAKRGSPGPIPLYTSQYVRGSGVKQTGSIGFAEADPVVSNVDDIMTVRARNDRTLVLRNTFMFFLPYGTSAAKKACKTSVFQQLTFA